MIAIDTSSLVAFWSGDVGADVDLVDRALADHLATLPPVVVTELLSVPGIKSELSSLILQLPRLESKPGYWERAGRLRQGVLAEGNTARLADTLIAQICLDHEIGLISRDRDFRHFLSAGLAWLPGGEGG